jgi:NADPH-dependent 2,4-dienoyl-CoA reductase/sulfur reductase-like enzyme
MGVGRLDDDIVCWHERRRFLQGAALAALGSTSIARAAARRARVVVVGGGFGGASCALQLRRLDPAIDITLVDPDERYVTCPMSDAALVGWRSMQSITISRAGLARAAVRHVRDRVAAIDAQARQVRLASSKTLAYDRLVVAPGIRFLWDRIEGYGEAASQRMPHAWRAGAQTDLLAAQLRAMDDGGVFGICVPSGLMRCPPAPFERASVVAEYLKQHKPRSKVLIFDANNHFPKQDVFAAAWQELYPGMIEWIPATEGGAVERVDASNMTLYTSRGAQRVAVANVIPHQAPGMLAVDAGLASAHGWCPVVAGTFESTLVANVHVIGDSCIAGAMPKSASAAHSQAMQCARAIAASLHGRELLPPEFESVCYSLLGRDRALAIHGRFSVADGEIRQVDIPSGTDIGSAQAQARMAAQWYDTIVAESFGS